MYKFYASLFSLIEQWYPIDTAIKEEIMTKSQVRKVKKGDYLFQEGQNANCLYFVVSGALRVFVLNDDFKEYTIRFGFENKMVGDPKAFLYQSKTQLNLQAFENSILLEVDSESLLALFKSSHNLSVFYKDFLEFELTKAQDRIINHLVKDAESRYDDFIEEYGNQNNRLSDRHIASYIGVTPEFFSKLKNTKLKKLFDLP